MATLGHYINSGLLKLFTLSTFLVNETVSKHAQWVSHLSRLHEGWPYFDVNETRMLQSQSTVSVSHL